MSNEYQNFILSGILKPRSQSEDRPWTQEDFLDHISVSLNVLTQLKNDLSKRELGVEDLVSLLRICSENCRCNPWVTSDHAEISLTILSDLRSVCKVRDIQSLLLFNPKDDILIRLLEMLRKDLEEGWERSPGAVAAVSWIFSRLRNPNLSAYVSHFFPQALRLLDDWRLENKLEGISMVSHFINESTIDQLKSSGYKDLISKTLMKMTHTRETRLAAALYPPLMSFFVKTQKLKRSFEADNLDYLCENIMNSMAISSDIQLKRIYCDNLIILLKHLKVKIIRWTSKIILLVKNNVTFPDAYEDLLRIKSLSCLEVLLNAIMEYKAKDVFSKYTHDVAEILLSLLYETSKSKEYNGTREATLNCLLLLKRLNRERLLNLCLGMDTVIVNEVFDKNVSEYIFSSD